MKARLAWWLAVASVAPTWAFMPQLAPSPVSRISRAPIGVRSLKAVVDPHHLTTFIPTIPSAADFDPAWLTATLQGIADAATATATETVKEVGKAASNVPNYDGWLGGPTRLIVSAIRTSHELLEGAGFKNTYGFAIIAFTLLVKVVTFPLTYKQIESTTGMQMIAPKLKEIQTKYKSDPQRQQELIARLYEENGVNPLAGCLPALVQIPVFISLYRALNNLALENELNEPFLWLPNLEGPTYGAAPGSGMDWLTKNWESGTPSLGWPDTIAFLTIPLFLIVSQIVSQKLVSPPQNQNDPSQQQSQAILKFLPFMVGYFSLNVPSGLGVYWITNNIVTTLSTVLVRSLVEQKKASDRVGGISQATVSSVVEPAPELQNRRGFGKAAPVPPPKPVDDDEEYLASKKKEEEAKKAAAQARNPRAPGLDMQTTIVRNPDGLTLIREQNGQVVNQMSVKMSDEEAEELLARWKRGEPVDLTSGMAEGDDAAPASGEAKPQEGGKSPPPSGPPRRKKFKKRRG